MTIQFNDHATLKVMSEIGFELLFEGALLDASTIFSAVHAIKPDQRAAALGLAFTTMELSSKAAGCTEYKEQKTFDEITSLNSDPVLVCLQALAELQQNNTASAQEMLNEVALDSDPIASQLAIKIIENELKGIR